MRGRDALMRDASLAARRQLVRLSFDPSKDTPEQMRQYGYGQPAQRACAGAF